MRKCIGFGDFEGKCKNLAGIKRNDGKSPNPYWCEKCDNIRRVEIKKSMEDILKNFEKD